MKHPPREGDLPRDELMKRAQQALEESTVPVEVFFKFSCEHCGNRCMFQEPNQLFEKGECDKCGGSTEVKVGGFSLHYHFHQLKEQRDN